MKRKIDLCLQLKAKAIQIDENETITLTNSFQNKRELIFARAKNGNSFIENDICALDQEYYLRIKNCLIELESGDLYSDNSQSKKIISNKKMAGIREIKKFKVRLYYRILSKNVVFVFLVRIKKDDNSKLDREIPQLRLMNTESEFQYYQGIMNGDDSALKEQLIQEHTSLKKQIFDYLNEHKRGERYV